MGYGSGRIDRWRWRAERRLNVRRLRKDADAREAVRATAAAVLGGLDLSPLAIELDRERELVAAAGRPLDVAPAVERMAQLLIEVQMQGHPAGFPEESEELSCLRDDVVASCIEALDRDRRSALRRFARFADALAVADESSVQIGQTAEASWHAVTVALANVVVDAASAALDAGRPGSTIDLDRCDAADVGLLRAVASGCSRAKELARRTDLGESSVRRRLARLRENGLLDETAPGRVSLTGFVRLGARGR